MNKFICNECEQTVSSESEEAPPGISWSDGHECTFTKIDKERDNNEER
tara:strand:+ start:628 stop:771 length:144 start_codon:yes stop_codon:yes gene_type:complete